MGRGDSKFTYRKQYSLILPKIVLAFFFECGLKSTGIFLTCFSIDQQIFRECTAHAVIGAGGGAIAAHIEKCKVVSFLNWGQ